MPLRSLFAVTSVAFLTLASAAFADGIIIKDAYVRSSTPSSTSGAAYMIVMNHSDTDDRLIAATSDVAKRVALHSHIEDANGVMRMGEIEGGIPLDAGGLHVMKRGGNHLMLMGVKEPLVQGTEISMTLTFEKAGDIEVVIPVDHKRKADHVSTDRSGQSSDG